jgi:hypothetical protein
MKKEEILLKIEEGSATLQDLFAYYDVRNLEGLEMAFEQKFGEPKVDLNYVIEGPAFIYKSRQKDNYNPLEEKMFFFSIVFAAFYGMAVDESTIILRSMGLFEGAMMLDKILEDKPEIKYFKHLYEMYIEKQNDLSYIVKEGVDKMLDFLNTNADKINMEELKKLGDTVMAEANKLLNKVQ